MRTPSFVFLEYRGGIVQLRLASPADLARIHDLVPARWSATSVPIEQLFCDPALLAYLDPDGDSRIRVHDLRAGHEWLRSRLKNIDRITERTDTVRIDDLDPDHPDTERMRALVRRRIKAGGQAGGEGATLTLAEIRAFRESYQKRSPNGDGVVTPAQLDDPELAELAALIIEVEGGAPDLSGDPGADEAKLDAFLELCRAHLAWIAEGELPQGAASTPILPFGDATGAASELMEALAPKLDQHFAQCDLLTQGSAAEQRLTIREDDLASLNVRDPEAIRAWLKEAPLGRPTPDCALDLTGWINPLFADAVRRLAAEVLPRALGQDAPVRRLDRAAWERARALFEPHRAWLARRPRALPAALDAGAIRALLDGPRPEALRARITEDRQASAELVALSDLEKLALLQRWILDLANNMVSFPALFSAAERALFEAGTLVLDGREIHLCVRVLDKAAHKAIAEGSNLFTAYVELERREESVTRNQLIAAGVTSGTRRGIALGKRGVFYDRDGKEWDARVVDLLVKPISVWEAAVAPFVRLRDFVMERIEKLVGGRLDAMEKQVAQQADAKVAAATPLLPDGAPAPPPAPPPPPAPAPAPAAASGSNLLLGGGVAFAALGSSAAFVLQTLSNTDARSALITTASIVLGVLSLSAFLGWLKLRRRDVSTLLEASGWAFNVRIYLRRNLSLRFTRVPPLPEGSLRKPSLLPRFVSGDERSPWRLLVLAALVGAAVVGWRYREVIGPWVRGVVGR